MAGEEADRIMRMMRMMLENFEAEEGDGEGHGHDDITILSMEIRSTTRSQLP